MGLTSEQVDRFHAKVEIGPGGCLNWTGTLNDQGYGIFGRHRRAHRISFEIAHGRAPVANILHSCDNPRCVNPTHLREGTQADNMADAQARHRLPHGDRHRNNKIGAGQMAEVIELIGAGVPTGEIAKRFRVSPSRVSMIRHGHVGPNHPAHELSATGRSDRQISDGDALDIYRRCQTENNSELAREYGVKVSFVADIKRGATYASVTGHRR